MSLAHKQRGSSSTQFLVTDGDNESQGRNTKENLPALGLNAPVLTGENNSQAASDLSAGLPQVKPLENGNYQRSFSLESSRVTPRSARVSSSSSATAGLYTPFPGFQIPNETIIPKEDPATVVKRKQTISAKDAIPVLPRPVAIVCLIFNILIPGSGTVISGLIAFFLTRKNIPLISRTSILFVNCFVGFMQLATIVFLMIGWFWSIAWGCAFVGFSVWDVTQSILNLSTIQEHRVVFGVEGEKTVSRFSRRL